MDAERKIKQQARAHLEGGWVCAIAGVITVFASVAAVYMFYVSLELIMGVSVGEHPPVNALTISLEFAAQLITFALVLGISPVLNGFFLMCFNSASEGKTDYLDVFYFFSGTKNYFKALQFNILCVAQLLLFGLLTFAPMLAHDISLTLCGLGNAGFYPLTHALLFTLGAALFLPLSMRTVMRFHVFSAAHDAPVGYIILLNKNLYKKHRLDFIFLHCTFLPWAALSLLVIPSLYTIPYLTVSAANSVRWFLRMNEEGKKV